LTWREAERVPWGILLLFGGGLSLAEAINSTGVDRFIAQGADGLSGVPLLPLLWVIALVTIVLTEFTSNTALVAAGLPVAEAIASRLGVPAAAVLVTMTLTASLGFMLPAGTAPNALVFASGRVTMRQMMRAGLWLDVACAFTVPLLVVGAMKLRMLPGM
jgi:sodium-dependent dicarboxylate transporter 2/3/5